MGKKLKAIIKNDILKSFYSAYSAESLLLYLQTILCHPSNQKYGHRIEYLIAEVLAMEEAEFGIKAVTRLEIEAFLNALQGFLNQAFSHLEDFNGFDQNKLIPLFWKGHRYYFFYALYDRPYENWREVIDAITSAGLNQMPAYAELEALMAESLEWQTELLLKITSLNESTHEQEGMYIPTQDFIDRVSVHFYKERKSNLSLKLGMLKNAGRVNLQKHAVYLGRYVDELSLTIGDKQLFIYPQIHLQIFLKKAVHVIMQDTHHHEVYMQSFRDRLGKTAIAVFKQPTLIYGLLAESHAEDFLSEIADYTFLFDSNKLVLFKAVEFRSGKENGKEINNLITKIESITRKIYKEKAVGIYRARRERMFALITEHLQIYIVLVCGALDIDSPLYPKKSSAWDHTWLFSMTDIKAILEHLTLPIDFLKFLEEEKYLLANAKLFDNYSLHDRFVWFLQNSNCYITIGSDTRELYFPYNRWGLTHAEDLYYRLNSDLDVYVQVESKFPGAFPDVELYRQNAYAISNPTDFETCYLSRLLNRFVWIFLPDHPLSLEIDEFRSSTHLFAPMFSDYIARFDRSFSELLDLQGIEEYDILIAPLGFLKRDQKYFSFLDDYVSEISEKNPYKFVNLPIGKRHVRTFFIYDFRYSYKIFSTAQNEGERKLMLNLLESILVVELKTEERITHLMKIVDRIIPLGKKGYAVDQLTVANPDIDRYGSPYKPTRTDEGVARRTVAIFIRERGFLPGHYTEEPAKLLLKSIYDYLQNLLEQKIVEYHEGFIVYAYQQLEKNEGRIEQRKLTAGMRANRQLDYSALDSLKVGTQKDSWLASAIRLLIHTALKVGMKGRKSPTQMDWTSLLAISIETLLAATNYEYISHNLLSIEITIDENYRFEFLDKMLDIDFNSFSQKDIERKYSYAIKEFEKAFSFANQVASQDAINDDERALIKERKIDGAFFQQYGLTYSNIILVLYVLSKMELPPPDEFPVYIMERQALITQILSHVIIDINRDDVGKTLEFLTLHEGIFPSEKFLYFGAMLRNRERITLCPFIELKDGSIMFGRECIDSAMNLWSDVFHGNLPFSVAQNSEVDEVMKAIRKERGDWLEMEAEAHAVAILGRRFVEARIDNFRRLSDSFKSKESCGEIDLLCVSTAMRTVFVFDCKSMSRIYGLYQAKRNIEEFYRNKGGHYQMLKRKRQFIEENLRTVLGHFCLHDDVGWTVREGFIVTNVHFAAFVAGARVDFVDVDELKDYLLNPHDQSFSEKQ